MIYKKKALDSIFNNIREYQKKLNTTVIIVSHSMEDMARLCDNLIVMHEGAIAMTGSCNEVFSNTDELVNMGLDIPQITKVMHLLSKSGIDVPCGIYTVEQAVEFLKSLRKNKKEALQ